MLKVFRKWLDGLFGDEEAVLLLLIILATLALIVGLSEILAPVITSVVLAYYAFENLNDIEQHRRANQASI